MFDVLLLPVLSFRVNVRIPKGRTEEKKTEAIETVMFVRCNIEPMLDEIQSRVLKTSSDLSSRARIFDEASRSFFTSYILSKVIYL